MRLNPSPEGRGGVGGYLLEVINFDVLDVGIISSLSLLPAMQKSVKRDLNIVLHTSHAYPILP